MALESVSMMMGATFSVPCGIAVPSPNSAVFADGGTYLSIRRRGRRERWSGLVAPPLVCQDPRTGRLKHPLNLEAITDESVCLYVAPFIPATRFEDEA